jgi:hypothetical protein
MGTGSFPGVESGRGVTLIPRPLLVPRSKNRVKLYLYSPYGPSWTAKRVKPIYNHTTLHPELSNYDLQQQQIHKRTEFTRTHVQEPLHIKRTIVPKLPVPPTRNLHTDKHNVSRLKSSVTPADNN